MRRFAALLCALGAAIAIAACGDSIEPPSATLTPAASPSTAVLATSVAGTPTAAPVPDPIAQPVTRGDFQLTVNGVTDPYVPSDEIDAAQDGYRWVMVDLSLTNVAQEELPYGEVDFVVVVADGEEWDASFAEQPQAFESGSLLPGETARGQLGFEIPAETVPQTLVFDPYADDATKIEIALR